MGQLARLSGGDTMIADVIALERIRGELARYTCAGPIPLTFEAEAGGDDVTITAVATVPDVDVWRRTGDAVPMLARHTTGVAWDADDAEIGRVVAMLTRIAFDHERAEWLLHGGQPVREAHPGIARVP